MLSQKGIAHIIILIAILLAVALAVLIFLGIRASRNLSLTPNQTHYTNPFSQTQSYKNPFDDYQNPFEGTKQ